MNIDRTVKRSEDLTNYYKEILYCKTIGQSSLNHNISLKYNFFIVLYLYQIISQAQSLITGSESVKIQNKIIN